MLTYEAQWTREAALRELRDKGKQTENVRKKPAVHFGESEEEDGKMEVVDKADNRKTHHQGLAAIGLCQVHG